MPRKSEMLKAAPCHQCLPKECFYKECSYDVEDIKT